MPTESKFLAFFSDQTERAPWSHRKKKFQFQASPHEAWVSNRLRVSASSTKCFAIYSLDCIKLDSSINLILIFSPFFITKPVAPSRSHTSMKPFSYRIYSCTSILNLKLKSWNVTCELRTNRSENRFFDSLNQIKCVEICISLAISSPENEIHKQRK